MSLKTDTKRARSLYRLIEEANKSINYAKIEMGYAIYELQKDNLYKKAIGNGIDKWNHFLKLPEVNMSNHTAKKLSSIYEVFCEGLGYDKEVIYDCEVDNLWYVITGDVLSDTDDEQTDELINLARQFSNYEFKEAVQDMVYGEERRYDYLVMQRVKETNNLRRVHGISTEDVLNKFNINESIPKRIKDEEGE
jgi:hypothetical protein